MKTFTYTFPGYSGPAGPTSQRPVITTVRVDEGPGHDIVHVWNRGGKAGELTVDSGDGRRVAELLLPFRSAVEEVAVHLSTD